MGIAMFSFNGLLGPLQSLMGWIVHRPNGRNLASRARAAATHPVAARACSSWAALPGSCREPRRPLRVVRVLETSQAASGAAGRMVISGRMADVCAELDRLAALEAAAG